MPIVVVLSIGKSPTSYFSAPLSHAFPSPTRWSSWPCSSVPPSSPSARARRRSRGGSRCSFSASSTKAPSPLSWSSTPSPRRAMHPLYLAVFKSYTRHVEGGRVLSSLREVTRTASPAPLLLAPESGPLGTLPTSQEMVACCQVLQCAARAPRRAHRRLGLLLPVSAYAFLAPFPSPTLPPPPRSAC